MTRGTNLYSHTHDAMVQRVYELGGLRVKEKRAKYRCDCERVRCWVGLRFVVDEMFCFWLIRNSNESCGGQGVFDIGARVSSSSWRPEGFRARVWICVLLTGGA